MTCSLTGSQKGLPVVMGIQKMKNVLYKWPYPKSTPIARNKIFGWYCNT
jgi:hypothetical protein